MTLSWVFIDLPYYKSLNKPFFAPPSWAFGPAWITNNILVITGNIWAINLWFEIKNNIKLKNKNLANFENSEINLNNDKNIDLEVNLDENTQKSKKFFPLDTKQILKNLKSLFILQILSWFNYVIFSALSFGLHKPLMFFWPTFSMWILTIASIYFASQIDCDISPKGFWHRVWQGRSIAFTFLTLFIWLTIAYTLGFYIWLKN